jgi:hypothetical protein
MKNQVELIKKFFGCVSAIQDTVPQEKRYDFNIFSILRRDSDEVNLHSRFIYDLVNPRGLHRQGDVFLRLLLEQLDILDFDSTQAYARREYNNIDIFVANDDIAIIIENKIHAGDQEQQLQRYYQSVNGRFKEVYVIYLTLYGDPPSSQSMGTLNPEEIITASYRDDIHTWLEHCAQNVVDPIVKEPIRQYKWLIEDLTGQSLWKGYAYLMGVKDLLMTEQNLELAIDISQALVETKIEIQFSFWQELERELVRQGYEIDDYAKYSRRRVKEYYQKDNHNFYYGLFIPLYQIGDTDRMYFSIVMSKKNILLVFRCLRNGKMVKNAQEPQFDYWTEMLKEWEGDWKRGGNWWIGWRYPATRFNFKEFRNQNVLSLVDSSKRARYTSELASEVRKVINLFEEEYPKRATR